MQGFSTVSNTNQVGCETLLNYHSLSTCFPFKDILNNICINAKIFLL